MNYTPEEIAECYGVDVGDECPEVTIDFPDWVVRTMARL
jgi:hypothetical protein